jgi:methyl-accepting chemotaxis protein
VAEHAGQLLERIVPMIRDTSNLVQEIAAASGEQMAAIQEINVGLNELDKVVEQNAAASLELARTSDDLSSQAYKLQDRVGFFHVLSTSDSQLDHPTITSAPQRRLPGGGGGSRRLPGPAARPVGGGHPGSDSPGHAQQGLPGQQPTHDAGSPGSHGAFSGPPSGNSQHGGGIVVNLDDDADFERF